MAADERTPRHGRHSAAGRHAAPQAAPSPETQPGIVTDALDEAIPQIVPIIDGDQETQLGDAPRPIGVDPQETGSFARIDASEGARVTTRVNASETASFRLENSRPMEAVRMSSTGRPQVERHETEVKSNKRVFAILGVAALLVVCVIGWLLARALVSVEQVPEETVEEQAQATGDEGIEYRGTTYTLTAREDGTYALTSTSEGSEGVATLYELSGTPVTLVLYNTVFVIPENLPDGTWDLIAHPLGGGSVTQQVTDAEGNPIVREGKIAQATLVGGTIQVTLESGEQESISLE